GLGGGRQAVERGSRVAEGPFERRRDRGRGAARGTGPRRQDQERGPSGARADVEDPPPPLTRNAPVGSDGTRVGAIPTCAIVADTTAQTTRAASPRRRAIGEPNQKAATSAAPAAAVTQR